MKETTVLYLATIIFSTITQGADISSPCDENSWSAFDCIQSLQQNILELQEQVTNQAAQLITQTDQLNTHSDQLNETQISLKNLQNNLVPIGFIYVQLPDQPEPHHLWETIIWTDISSQYAGLFFRVLGGGSAQFNVTQVESSPRISQVETNTLNSFRFNIDMPTSGWSLGVSSGGHPGVLTRWALRFFTSTAEIRPRNKAVRIWKRLN